MIRNTTAPAARPIRLLPVDLGVTLLLLLALAAALVLRGQAEGRMQTFQSQDVPVQFSYPTQWRDVGTLQEVLLHVEDPVVASPFKTTLTVENRPLDPASPPTLDVLANRRIDDRSTLTGYHFLSSEPTTVAGAESMVIEYTYVVQPIDEPRRPSLPVVVVAREYVVHAGDQSYYFTLAAPEEFAGRASTTMNDIIKSIRL